MSRFLNCLLTLACVNLRLSEGANKLRVVSQDLSDEFTVGYQTKKWSKPAKLKLEEIAQKDGIATMEPTANCNATLVSNSRFFGFNNSTHLIHS